MKYPIYCLYDAAAKAFLAPQLNTTDEAAKRDLALALSNAQNAPLGFSPKDFSLYMVGYFDNDTAEINGICPIELVCHATAVTPPTITEVVKDER